MGHARAPRDMKIGLTDFFLVKGLTLQLIQANLNLCYSNNHLSRQPTLVLGHHT